MAATRRDFGKALAALPLLGAASALPRPAAGSEVPVAPLPDRLTEWAIEAYIYGYPLLTMDVTELVSTNVVAPEGARAPRGQFAHLRHYPDASFRTVTAPNADTLYSVAWLDLGAEPYLLSLPALGQRYALFPMLSAWTEVFAVPGTRTTGDVAQRYLIAGPRWNGVGLEGVPLLRAPTDTVWLLGRTYCSGTPEDYAAVHALQDRYELRPLSAVGKDYTAPAGTVDPAIDAKTAVRDQVNALPGGRYFKRLAELMKANPPGLGDGVIVAKMAALGLVPGQDYDPGAQSSAVQAAIAAAPAEALRRIAAQVAQSPQVVNGWGFWLGTGYYGQDYQRRALVTMIGLGANLPQDAIYPVVQHDLRGEKLNAAESSYRIRFPPGGLPPVKGFWSITLYDDEFFFVANPLNRYSISPRDALQSNADGSIDIWIQSESPGAERESNWLPTPKGSFVLMLRLYWPADEVLNGLWQPPAVERV